MKNLSAGRLSILLLLAILFSPFLSFSQQVYDANYQTINFGGTGVTITYKVGTTGKSAGNVTLYQNVITIGGQQIDAIVRTTALTSGTVMDYFDRTGTGTGYTNNLDSYFSPQFTFPTGGGSATFVFEFILGGSYNNTTNTGTLVVLQNVRVNTYDIDGNGSSGTNQFNEFGGFLSSELATNSTVAATYNSSTGLTKFRSSIYSNVSNASDPTTRVRVTYEELSKLTMQVGSEGAGQAYYFIDFGVGASWPATPATVTAPTLDLNTNTAGNHNAANFCSTAVPFTAGATNINSVTTTPSGGTTINQIKITFPTADIADASYEQLLVSGATSGGTIALNFANAASISNIVLSSKTYTVTAAVANGESSLTFAKSGSATMTLAEGEALLDALRYMNTDATPTTGTRNFEVRLKDGAYESQAYNFVVTVGTVPVFTVQPSNQTVVTGTNAVLVSNAGSGTYQWQVNPTTGSFSNVSNSTLYSGATTNTLTIKNTPASLNNYQYRAVATNGACVTNSLSATVTLSASLPVKWESFSAKEMSRVVYLSWSTSNEINSKEFYVQHSVDGVNYKDVGVVHAKGSTSSVSEYQFAHRTPAVGNNYYRIRQTDIDGRSANSKVLTVSIKTDAKIFTVLTNPVLGGNLTVQVHVPATLALYSSSGSVVFRQPVTTGRQSFSVSGYGAGTFTLVGGSDVQMILIK